MPRQPLLRKGSWYYIHKGVQVIFPSDREFHRERNESKGNWIQKMKTNFWNVKYLDLTVPIFNQLQKFSIIQINKFSFKQLSTKFLLLANKKVSQIRDKEDIWVLHVFINILLYLLSCQKTAKFSPSDFSNLTYTDTLT